MFALLLIALSLVLHLRFVEYADDDAYIHMRVARNLWLHGEPYFNIGERVMASTSPLWIILTSPLAALGDAQPLGLAVLNSLILVGAALAWGAVYGKIFQSGGFREQALAALVAFFTLAPASMGLMETALALLLVGLAFLGVFANAWWGLPAAFASVFARPECAIFCLAAIALKVMTRRAWSVKEVVSSALVVGSGTLFQALEYGALYPHTARVKEIVYSLSAEEFVRALFAAGYGEWIAKFVLPGVVCVAFILLLWVISRVKIGAGEALRAPLVALFAPAVVIVAVYGAKRLLVFPWYVPLFLVPLNLWALRLMTAGRSATRLFAAVLLVPFTITSLFVVGTIARPSLSPWFEAGARARNLRLVGAELATKYPHATLMAPEIGALGFEFKEKIIDSVGLASPEALPFHPLRVPEQRPTAVHGGVPAALVAQESPKLIVGLESFMLDFLRSSEASLYDIVRVSPARPEDLAALPNGQVFGSKTLVIASRKG